MYLSTGEQDLGLKPRSDETKPALISMLCEMWDIAAATGSAGSSTVLAKRPPSSSAMSPYHPASAALASGSPHDAYGSRAIAASSTESPAALTHSSHQALEYTYAGTQLVVSHSSAVQAYPAHAPGVASQPGAMPLGSHAVAQPLPGGGHPSMPLRTYGAGQPLPDAGKVADNFASAFYGMLQPFQLNEDFFFPSCVLRLAVNRPGYTHSEEVQGGPAVWWVEGGT